MITEASMKANKLHIMHAAKLISKMKSGDEREQAVTELEQKAKKMGFSRKNYEEILDKQGAYEETMHKAQEEAENNRKELFNNYIADGKKNWEKNKSHFKGSYISDDMAICSKLIKED